MPFSETPWLVLAIVFCVLAVAAHIKARSTRGGLPLPPGPPAHWLFGNKFPKSHAYREFAQLTEEYGPVFTLRRGGSLMVIIGRLQAAISIMEKEGAALVDRPLSISGGTASGNMRILLMGAGGQFRKYRKALHAQMHAKIAESYEPIQMANAKNLLLDILDQPDRHQIHAKRYAASVIMTLTYGKTTPTSYSDPEVQAVNRCLNRLGSVLRPGAFLVDSYPALRFVPGYLSELKQYHRDELRLFRSQLDAVRANMARNEARPSFAKYLIERQQEFDLSDDELAYLAGSMFGAGSDTSAAAISIVMMAAACYPTAQAKVQEELDAVVGPSRLPTFGDQDVLPQVNAFVLESFRWRPVSVSGFPHRATRDIIWGGYCIPAGATVLGNHWAIGRDPDVFPNPDHFDPQRWLDANGRIREDIKFFNFGFGRRVCPGQHIANQSVFINTALILWAFKIYEDPMKPIDKLAFSDTANMHPLPFSLRFSNRVESLREIVDSYEESMY